MERPPILVVEDDAHMRDALKASLAGAGYPVATAGDVKAARKKLSGSSFGLVVTDLKMPGGSGLDVLSEVRTKSPDTPVILLTAYGSVDIAVDAMKRGAADFIQKPFSFNDLEEVVRRTLDSSHDGGNGSQGQSSNGIITRDPAMLEILARAAAVAPSKVPVLVQGESGTGKELIAAHIHSLSPRRDKPLVAINCAAIPEHLLESELFGHEKGAFTGAHARKIGKFEQAHRSTILLDEIGEMSLNLQAKLLRVLEEWQVDRLGGSSPVSVDVRLVATTNADLAASVREEAFREDLYFRLAVVPLTLPPLRERPEDIPILAEHFLKRAAGAHKKDIQGFSRCALDALMAHPFKGNVRELRNAVDCAAILSPGPLLRAKDLSLEGFDLPGASGSEVALRGSVREVERELILMTLEREGWNRTRASEKLGISVRTLRNKLQEYRRGGHLPAERM